MDIIYNDDGSIKPFYILSKEKDIKETQIKADIDELEYKFKQNLISKEEYDSKKEELNNKLLNQNEMYNDLIFIEIDSKSIEEIKNELKEASLNKIDLERLSSSITAIIEKKLNDFKNNNSEFQEGDIKLWNFKYDRIANNYSKIRELESFINSIN